MPVPPDQVRQGRGFTVLPFCMTGHANRDLHRNQHTPLPGTCRPFVGHALALKAFLRYPRQPKVWVMDGKTILLIGLGVVALLILGFCALPS
jgi:hypothetical protein